MISKLFHFRHVREKKRSFDSLVTLATAMSMSFGEASWCFSNQRGSWKHIWWPSTSAPIPRAINWRFPTGLWWC